jgi:N-methylhydantoinase A/acetophenone carboxylase
MVAEIAEQTDDNGTATQSPEAAQVLQQAQTLIDQGARVLVVALDNSEKNAANERRVREIIKNEYPREYLGSVSVFLASDISSREGREARINTAALNAYIHPKLARLLYKAGEELRQLEYSNTLFIGHNNGSVARVAKTRAINTYNSGPAAGLLGAREIGRLYSIDDLISTDMGGTSFDIGYVRNGRAGYALNPDVEGFDCNLPMMFIQALGTGGGSIAHVEDGKLKVGPQSAGALPGPASFNLGGTDATLTDANLVLGVLDPDYFLGGTMKLDVERARAAIERNVAEPLGVSIEEAAAKIKAIVDGDMGHAIARVAENLPAGTPRVVVAYGGAGGLHAADIAKAAEVDKVIMTPFSAVSSAYSSSLLDPGHLYYRAIGDAIDSQTLAEQLQENVATMRAEAQKDMRGEGFAPEELREELQLFVSAQGGSDEVLLHSSSNFWEDAAQKAALEADAREALQCGDKPLQLNTIALMVRAVAPHYQLQEQAIDSNASAPSPKRQTSLYNAETGAFEQAPVYDRDAIAAGSTLTGPALVESENTTLLVPADWQLSIDGFANAVFTPAA